MQASTEQEHTHEQNQTRIDKEKLILLPLQELELGVPFTDIGLHINRVKRTVDEQGDGFDLEFNVHIPAFFFKRMLLTF